MTEKIAGIKWVNIVLFFSLALNFFIAGYVVSDIQPVRDIRGKKVSYKRPDVRIVDYFPKAEREHYRHSMYEQRDKIMPIQREIFEKQKNILTIITNPTIDEQKLRDAFRKYQATNNGLQNLYHEKVIDMLLAMDVETRNEILQRSKKAHEHRKKKREKWMRHAKERYGQSEGRHSPPPPRN